MLSARWPNGSAPQCDWFSSPDWDDNWSNLASLTELGRVKPGKVTAPDQGFALRHAAPSGVTPNPSWIGKGTCNKAWLVAFCPFGDFLL